jgi:predicted adenine nucleotide alpha hydrolase (AANH) superfamily ATPase
MNLKVNHTLLKKLKKVSDTVPVPDVLALFQQLTEAYKEHQVTERETAKIQSQKEIILKQIEKKYDAFYFVFEKVFEERRETIHKMFDIIDRGLKANDKELIGIGLQNLSKVVASSPFGNLQQLQEMLDSGEVIEI